MDDIGVAACVRNLAGAAATRAKGCDSLFLLIPSDYLVGEQQLGDKDTGALVTRSTLPILRTEETSWMIVSLTPSTRCS